MSETAWDNLQTEKANLLPTPPIGEPVVWYLEGDKNRPCAAQCNGIEGAGRIYATIHTKGGMVMHRGGCYHISHPIHEKPNFTTKNGGAWDYPDGVAPKKHYDFHRAEIVKREEAILRAKEQSEQATAAFLKKQADKKKLTDPLPTA